jgi:4-amino-4-deoxy-L-arabinose transferase-like glycosyltransferase
VNRPAALTRQCIVGLVVLLAIGAALRFHYNNVVRYGNGDEYHYRLQLQQINNHGWQAYPGLVKAHLVVDPDYPAPYRWGYLAVGQFACFLRQTCDERSLAWVSTFSGLAVVTLVAMLGLTLVGRRTALLATALAITSPLHLDLGRRAYADELHTACVLLALWCLARVAMKSNSEQKARVYWVWVGLSVLAMTLAWSIKESILFFVPAILVWLVWLRRVPKLRAIDLAIVLLPAAGFIAGFVWLNHGFSPLGELLSATHNSFLHRYSTFNQYGPPHRPLIELFSLSPVVLGLLPIVPFAAWGTAFAHSDADDPGHIDDNSEYRRHAQALFLTFGLIVLGFFFLPKNLRFYAVLDPLARLLVAWFLCEVLPITKSLSVLWWAALILGHSALELAIFHRTFVVSSVTDPTANAIFSALQVVPSDTWEKSWRPPAVVIVCGLLSASFAWISASRPRFSRRSVVAAVIITGCALGLPQLLRPHRMIMGASPTSPRAETLGRPVNNATQ